MLQINRLNYIRINAKILDSTDQKTEEIPSILRRANEHEGHNRRRHRICSEPAFRAGLSLQELEQDKNLIGTRSKRKNAEGSDATPSKVECELTGWPKVV